MNKIEAWQTLATINPKLSRYMCLLIEYDEKGTLTKEQFLKCSGLVRDNLDCDYLGELLGTLAFNEMDRIGKKLYEKGI